MPAEDEASDASADASDASADASDASADDSNADPSAIDDATVVQTAAEAAEDVVFSRFDRGEVADVDIGVSFEDAVLEVDVYLDAEGSPDPERVADDAALAARAAVDDLLEE